MAEDKINIPSGMGGLVRYFDDFKSKLELKPEYVLGAIIVVILLEAILHLM